MIRIEHIEIKIRKVFKTYFENLGFSNRDNIEFIFKNDVIKENITFNVSNKLSGFNISYCISKRYEKIENVWQDLIIKFDLNLGDNMTIFINNLSLGLFDNILINRNSIDSDLLNFRNQFIIVYENDILPILKQTEDIRWMDKILNSDLLDFDNPCKYFPYRGLFFKKIIVARLANNPMFEEIYMTIKKMYEDYLKNNVNEKYSNELNVLNVLFERLKTIEPLKNPNLI
ncbi:MAG: hypothetical protein LBL58_00165 [Tannerellaceae bacterium]|jgi:hypothetical protein|nr:hypothetical protein [Tannerellaceae bacterium]